MLKREKLFTILLASVMAGSLMLIGDTAPAGAAVNTADAYATADYVSSNDISSKAAVTTSFCSDWENINALNDGYDPSNSNDRDHDVYGNWPETGTQWVKYTFDKDYKISKTDLYWFKDGAGIDVPSSYKIKYWNGSSWVEVSNASGLGTSADQYNSTSFDSITTNAIMVEMNSNGDYSTGILEWKVYGQEASSETESGTNTGTNSGTNTDTNTGTDTGTNAIVNPGDYIDKTTINILPASSVDISSRTQEFTGLVKECTKVAYAYADPRENSDSKYNASPDGAQSLAVYIFGYDSTTETEFLNTKKYIPYVLNKLYFNSKLKNTWYNTLTNNGKGVYLILEKPGALEANEKFGNPNDGFGIRIMSGTMEYPEGATEIMFHEMAHCIWDCTSTTDDFYFGVDPKTNIDYGTGNLVTLWNRLYDDSIKSNNFYAPYYGWDYSHENFAETSAYFFKKDFREQLKANDPIVYNIMKQIYTEYDL